MPKSSSLTTPSGVTLTLPGLRSRWVIPFSCAASSASAIWRAMFRASFRRRPGVEDSRGFGQFLRERFALDELQHEPANALALFDAVDGRDVRVVQRGDHSRLALEARDPTRLGRKRERQNLDRDVATELGVVGPVHLAHSAAAKERLHFEGPDPPAYERGDHITRRGGWQVQLLDRQRN